MSKLLIHSLVCLRPVKQLFHNDVQIGVLTLYLYDNTGWNAYGNLAGASNPSCVYTYLIGAFCVGKPDASVLHRNSPRIVSAVIYGIWLRDPVKPDSIKNYIILCNDGRFFNGIFFIGRYQNKKRRKHYTQNN